MPLRYISETRREERNAVMLIVFVVLAAALATGLLEDPEDRAPPRNPSAVQTLELP